MDTMPVLAWSIKMAEAAKDSTVSRFLIGHQVSHQSQPFCLYVAAHVTPPPSPPPPLGRVLPVRFASPTLHLLSSTAELCEMIGVVGGREYGRTHWLMVVIVCVYSLSLGFVLCWQSCSMRVTTATRVGLYIKEPTACTRFPHMEPRSEPPPLCTGLLCPPAPNLGRRSCTSRSC